MSKDESIKYKLLRESVANLFYGVLSGQISVRQALANFPKDCDDTTLVVAWQALCHYEADEDIRAKNIRFREEQDEYIRFIADTLKDGEALPQNIISEYIPYHPKSQLGFTNSFKGVFKKLFNFLNI